jgi:hypothetical protein
MIELNPVIVANDPGTLAGSGADRVIADNARIAANKFVRLKPGMLTVASRRETSLSFPGRLNSFPVSICTNTFEPPNSAPAVMISNPWRSQICAANSNKLEFCTGCQSPATNRPNTVAGSSARDIWKESAIGEPSGRQLGTS